MGRASLYRLALDDETDERALESEVGELPLGKLGVDEAVCKFKRDDLYFEVNSIYLRVTFSLLQRSLRNFHLQLGQVFHLP